MTAPEAIDPAIRRRIDNALDRIERDESVRIIVAAESGSRAWGFPSPDSDYDARFIYVRRLADYLSIEPPRDVIEAPIDGLLDVNGWDVRKALQLLCKSNAVLIEWLVSPIRYRSQAAWPDRLLALARASCHLPALAYHYDRLARRAYADVEAADAVAIKRYCYALRPALALHWIRRRREPPPMDLASLLEGVKVSRAVRSAAERLVEHKARTAERDRIGRVVALDRYIADALADRADQPSFAADKRETIARANALFAALVREIDASR
jgi:uncharacterized protein